MCVDSSKYISFVPKGSLISLGNFGHCNFFLYDVTFVTSQKDAFFLFFDTDRERKRKKKGSRPAKVGSICQKKNHVFGYKSDMSVLCHCFLCSVSRRFGIDTYFCFYPRKESNTSSLGVRREKNVFP